MDFSFSSYLIPLAYALYGFIFLFRTPAFMGRNGLVTYQTRRSERIWNYGHRVAGIYCVCAAVLTAGLSYLQNSIAAGTGLPPIFWLRMAIEIATIAAAIPIVNAITGKRFPGGKREKKKK